MDMIDSKSWYLFRFKQVAEPRIMRRASRLDVEVLCPKVTDWKRCGRDRKPKRFEQPAFHGYLIIGCAGELPIAAILDMHYSVRPFMVKWGDNEPALARIPLQEIEAIKSNRLFKASTARNVMDEAQPDPKYTKGELLRILGGAATGLEGKVIAADPQSREAQLEMDGWPVKLRVAYDLLERAA